MAEQEWKDMNPLKITIVTDGGPWAEHNMPCPIYTEDASAVLNLNNGVFEPSWDAQRDGWATVQLRGWRGWLARRLLRLPPDPNGE